MHAVHRVLAATVVLLGAAGLAGCDGSPAPDEAGQPTRPPPAQDAHDPAVRLLPEQSASDPTMRVADGVAAPTNRWYSALAFGDPGLPVFPQPLSFRATDGGFSMGLTRPEDSERAILAPARDDLAVAFVGGSGFGEVVSAGPVGVSLDWDDAAVHLAQGWPVVGVTADAPLEAELSVAFARAGEGVWVATVSGTEYGVRVRDGSVDGDALDLAAGGQAQFFAVPDGGVATAFAKELGEVVTSPSWDGRVTSEHAITTVTYAARTVIAMPADRAEQAGLTCDLGRYATIHGAAAVCGTGSVTWEVPRVDPRRAPNLEGIAPDAADAIRTALAADAAALPPLPADTYFGGKALARLANLILIAEQLGEDDVAARAEDALAVELEAWGDADRCVTEDARCFVFDPTVGGVVGHAVAFGSEDFNDHHFHYGYLLHAAAIAGERDPALAERIGPVFDLVAADIAAAGDGAFPPIRVFDPVAGHSWASGYAPFADGNNQESSSEAVNAWNAVALWAQVRDDRRLADRAAWMLSTEADASVRLWLDPDLSAFPRYDHHIVALEWGAKRDYATWFSPEPSAMLGIQLIPAAAATLPVWQRVEAEHIVASVGEAAPESYDVPFGDYLLMYLATAGGDHRREAWTEAVRLPSSAIDDGNSRAWMLAWIAAAER